MEKTVVLEKRVGQTPLQAIQEWKRENPEYADVPAAYAGRLDPMASGKLLILLGDECKKLKEYIALKKEYCIEVIFGLGSDTGDVLGLIETDPDASKITAEEVQTRIQEVIRDEKGIHEREYPIYSSKTVKGIPLFQYALTNRLSEIEIPKHQEEIFDIDVISIKGWPVEEVKERVDSYLSVVPLTEEPSKAEGRNFRIDDVRQSWKKALEQTQSESFVVLKLNVVCGSGVYMRSLAGRIGEAYKTHALALSIHRAKIG